MNRRQFLAGAAGLSVMANVRPQVIPRVENVIINPYRFGGGGGLTGLAYLQSLFVGGQVGAIYNCTDPTTMYQDETGTTLITEANNTIFRIADLSGNGNHLKAQGETTELPFFDYSDEGVKHPAYQEHALLAFNTNGGVYFENHIIVAVMACSVTGERIRPVGCGSNVLDSSESQGRHFSWASDDTLRFDGGYQALSAGTYTSDTDILVTAIKVGSQSAARYDGNYVQSLAAPTAGTLSNSKDLYRIGHNRSNGTGEMLIKAAVFLEDTWTDTQIANIESAVAEMAGYTY